MRMACLLRGFWRRAKVSSRRPYHRHRLSPALQLRPGKQDLGSQRAKPALDGVVRRAFVVYGAAAVVTTGGQP